MLGVNCSLGQTKAHVSHQRTERRMSFARLEIASRHLLTIAKDKMGTHAAKMHHRVGFREVINKLAILIRPT